MAADITACFTVQMMAYKARNTKMVEKHDKSKFIIASDCKLMQQRRVPRMTNFLRLAVLICWAKKSRLLMCHASRMQRALIGPALTFPQCPNSRTGNWKTIHEIIDTIIDYD